MTEADLRQTIVLNAKTLIEKDADFARFAGRILLTYHLRGGPGLGHRPRRHWHAEGLPPQGLPRTTSSAGSRSSGSIPRLLDYDLDRLAGALDPSADLDFDYPRHPDPV